MARHDNAMEILRITSRTFYIPIARLPLNLQKVVTSAYLCMRAVDEIEDHPALSRKSKMVLLRRIGHALQVRTESLNFSSLLNGLDTNTDTLPNVTIQMRQWCMLAPLSIAPRIWDATATMADRMAFWAERKWCICTESDLDSYTFCVAGAIGLLLSDIWAWYDGTRTNRHYAVGFGRGLQTVNILRNRVEDLARGVDLFPDKWDESRMRSYADQNLRIGEKYLDELPSGPIRQFCLLPLTLAKATLEALARGESKLDRRTVIRLANALK